MNSDMPRKGIRYLVALYLVSALILVVSAVFSQREYQDSWILEGLFLQTLLLCLTFMLVVVNVRSSTKLVLLVASFLMFLSAVPNLKYVQITGVFDSIAHYGYANRLISSGHVPESGFYAKEYSGTPGMHVFLATIVLITGLSTNLAIKLLLVVLSFITPFILYFLTKDVFSEDTRRFLLIALCFSLPIAGPLFGTTFALPMYFLFIAVFLRQTLVAQSPRQFALILVITGAALIVSHGITPLFLTLLMFVTPFVLKVSELVRRGKIMVKASRYMHVASLLAVFLLAWWAYNAQQLFYDFLVRTLESLFVGTSTIPIPSKFYELSLSEQITLIYVRFYELFVILGLGLVGLILYLNIFRKRYSRRTRTLYLQILCILCATALISTPFFLKLTSYTFERFITYSKLLSPFFIGLSLCGLVKYLRVHIKRPSIQNLSFTLFLFTLFVPLLLTNFVPQPLLPKNDENEYIVDYRLVNTVYQIDMIRFAESHYVSGSKIAADTVTSWQIFGLTNTSFFLGYSWNNPLYENNTESDMILLHYSGISGSLNENVQYRTRAKLNEFKFTPGNQIVYDNGESFIIVPSD